jgi:hypothetical protein
MSSTLGTVAITSSGSALNSIGGGSNGGGGGISSPAASPTPVHVPAPAPAPSPSTTPSKPLVAVSPAKLPTNPDGKHVMVSYCWNKNAKSEHVIALSKYLRDKHGYDVCRDEGACAVEQPSVPLTTTHSHRHTHFFSTLTHHLD